jgi:amino-acid N-acetyltransferase
MPAVIALLASAGLPTADLSSALQLTVWILKSDSLKGAIGLERFGPTGLMRSLVVAPSYRCRGLGRELVAWLEHDARAGGIQQLVLLTETAEPFFRSLGYSAIDRHLVGEALKQSAEFRSLCPVSAVCMRKTL